MRKLKFICTVTLKDDAMHVRLVVENAVGKALFDQIGRTKKLSAEQIKKIPSDELIIKGLDDKIKESIKEAAPEIAFEKIKNNLE